MKHLIRTSKVIAAAAIFAAIGCAKGKSSDLYSPPPVITENGATGSGIKVEFNPKLDVLFVVDNSMSMKDEQDKLRAGISRFVNGFGENSFIDYRVGVISVYDSERCGKPDKDGDMVRCYPEGKLQAVRNADGTVAPGIAYVQRGEGAADILKATLNIGALSLKDGGPESEEMFAPILKAVSPAQNAANGDFLRPDAHLVIVIVSDEDDASIDYTPDSFLGHLYNIVGSEQRVSIYGVLATGNCARQSYAEYPERLARAVSLHGGTSYQICDANFGNSLANMGDRIRRKLYRINPISLPTVAQSGTLKLFYGDTEIPKGKGWTHNIALNKIEIDSTLDVPFVAGQRFRASYTEVNSRLIRRNQAKRNLH